MTKGIIFYTDSQIEEPIKSVVMRMISYNAISNGVRLPIVSVSLKPLKFGLNVVLKGEKRSYPTMIKQIRTALEVLDTDYVFFCEHDVLYPLSHFQFTPEKDNIFYYNRNVWRWQFGAGHVVRYDRMLPLSTLCVNRRFALDHYRAREKAIQEAGVNAFRSREPELARKWGYEPGTKKTKRGGFSDDDFETWASDSPVIDIRHEQTFSPPKVTLESFKHAPVNWEEMSLEDLEKRGPMLKHHFNL